MLSILRTTGNIIMMYVCGNVINVTYEHYKNAIFASVLI